MEPRAALRWGSPGGLGRRVQRPHTQPLSLRRRWGAGASSAAGTLSGLWLLTRSFGRLRVAPSAKRCLAKAVVVRPVFEGQEVLVVSVTSEDSCWLWGVKFKTRTCHK